MKTVVVAGDLIWDNNLVNQPTLPIHHHEALATTVLHERDGGAWYLRDIVALACGKMSDIQIHGHVSLPKSKRTLKDCVGQAHQVWALHDKERGDKPQVWRISKFLGCQNPPEGSAPVPLECEPPDPDLLVLDDICLGFRDHPKHWPAALQPGGKPKHIVLKTSSTPTQGRLWATLLKKHANRLTVIVSASLLRTRGADISQALSWDKTIEDTVRELTTGISSHDLARCRRVIVHFGTEGAASFTRCRPAWEKVRSLHPRATFERFLYHPEETENAWRARRPGRTFGCSSLLAATMARHLLAPESYPLFIALGRGLAAVRAAHQVGGGAGDEDFDSDAAHSQVSAILHPPKADDKSKREEPAAVFCSAFPHAILDDPVQVKRPAGHSDLLADLTGKGLEYVTAKATEIVVDGLKDGLSLAPKARYGKYMTVDREEIERINAVRNLIITYQNSPADLRPFSIAVFGPPGSGKSFAIKQLADELFGRKGSTFEFNLSQLRSPEELHRAFHRVRDVSVQGKIPLVFWDEFDSDKLDWLRHFLAPMQDAEFQEGEAVHHLGKAIFVFAGGTCETFEAFVEKGKEQAQTDDKEAAEEAKQKKVPDFISRLRGFVNVKGPNPTGIADNPDKTNLEQDEAAAQDDPAHIIRRGIILRVTLEMTCPQIIDPRTKKAAISAGVVRAFLRTRKFLHGARSLTSVVTMSALSGKRHFDVSSLPQDDLLNLHVLSPDFMGHVRQGQLHLHILEALAEACHEAWMEQKKKDGWRYGDPRDDKKKLHPLLKPYAELDEEGKEGNRRTARVTQAKLLDVGYTIRPRRTSSKKPPPKITKTVRDRLVRIEHDVWLRDHLLRGYDYAPNTNEDLLLHRDVCPFDRMPPEDKALDEAIARRIEPVLQANGYELIKVDRPARARSSR
ncbi:MAG: AAA family ATPase [Candidatus Brocadiae bacterium]|nr:AAA family ATPase [Candidatus Brocadiia bacterium]